MAGFIPAIHVLLEIRVAKKTWMPGTRLGMTTVFREKQLYRIRRNSHLDVMSKPEFVYQPLIIPLDTLFIEELEEAHRS
jgi:hypothetical protein